MNKETKIILLIIGGLFLFSIILNLFLGETNEGTNSDEFSEEQFESITLDVISRYDICGSTPLNNCVGFDFDMGPTIILVNSGATTDLAKHTITKPIIDELYAEIPSTKSEEIFIFFRECIGSYCEKKGFMTWEYGNYNFYDQ